MDAFRFVRMRQKRLGKLGLLVAVGVLFGCAKKSDLPPPEDGEGLDDPIAEPMGRDVDPVGSIQIMSNRPVQILLDGKPFGEAPQIIDDVPAGNHDVTYVDEVNGNITMTVEVVAGKTSRASYNLPPKAKETGTE